MPERFSTETPFLSTLTIHPAEKKTACVVLVVSFLFFLLAIPFAKVQLPKVWGFIPVYESALVINDLITAVLLFGQFRILGTRSLCVLACGYLFTAATAVVHALSFPDLFAPGGLLGAGPQTTAWLYMFWHGGFPCFVIAYALMKSDGSAWRASDRHPLNVFACAGAALCTVAAFAFLACQGQMVLPAIMQGSHYTPAMKIVVGSIWLMSVVSLLVLYRQRPHSVLDMWLGVVMGIWVCDIGLSAVFNAGRFDLGFYAGRIYGLVASCGVLLVLLLENGKLYAQLVEAHAREHRKSLELEQLNKELEAFSYSVSHDLRAPLRAINGFSKALHNQLGEQSDEKGKHYLDRIITAAAQMGTLIDDLLNLSRVTRVSLKPESVDMTKMAREILAGFSEAEPARDVQSIVEEGLVVQADSHLLSVMLQNLLGNAWKYTGRQAQARIEFGVSRIDGKRVFCVRDNGAGFDAARAQNLFAPFQRFHTESEFPGTGIGLATVQRIVSRHGGRIWAESVPGQGASFYFVLEKAA